MGNRGGMISQPFVFILILLLVVFTLVFGFRIVNNLRNTQEKLKYAVFKSDFAIVVNSVYDSDKGTMIVFSKDSKNHKPLVVPKGIKSVCFEDDNVYFEYYPGSKNRFADFSVENLKGRDCINLVSGRFSFTLENVVFDKEVFVLISKNGT